MPRQEIANSGDEYEIQLPFGPPPVLPDVQKQLKEYLLCPDRLPIHNYEEAQKYWPRESNPRSLYHCDMAPLGTTLKVDRDPTTGKLLQFREVPLDTIGCSAKNSMSLKRAPGPPDQAVRGSNMNFPFWPGGFPELVTDDVNDDQSPEIDFVNNLLTVPPGFEEGARFKSDGKTLILEDEKEPFLSEDEFPALKAEPEKKEVTVVNLMSIMKQEEDLLGLWQEETKQDVKRNKEQISIQNFEVDVDEEAAEVIPKEDTIPVLKINETVAHRKVAKTQWAEELDVNIPVTDFEKKIPVMARTYPFTLDTFQKKAILKLEEHANVFVAAHTSAGKTVVAEYAIALSKYHKTKAIYTSPIKALSNQKYRDFKDTFKDVGLITGDFQINQTAQCLIMTTEILRSMLYCGSDIVRDLEYVIFDEVHYINDNERGHVWEEVLILLPKHVSIVMLSATVPNTLQFAEWVGNTKKKKVYVISTNRRPVPLMHYLYTGSGGKSKDERFLILGEDAKKFIHSGYELACEAKKSRQKHKSYGPKQGPPLNSKQETTMWIGLIDHLKKNDKLPVVAFTLSRNRCDQNATNLERIDLTTAKEKGYVHMFFNRSIENLKMDDRKLPQVVQLEELLSQGIGVHHSGILPILKEIVEMLFQKGYVKLLFATETFAMGVNMPARTVVFDSVRKFDGQEMRTLQPAEYIQMAGRAGRRGLDKTGTVIIICKLEPPKQVDLERMMLGSPTLLQSKFRVTYAMILNLFRVKKIPIEQMMSHSFLEFDHCKSQKKYEKELKDVEERMKKYTPNKQKMESDPLSEFYKTAREYFEIWSKVRSDILTHPEYGKKLVPGRVLLVSYEEHVNKLGILLGDGSIKGEKVFKVLVLCHSNFKGKEDFSEDVHLSLASPQIEEETTEKMKPLWYKMLGAASKSKVFVPDGVGGHDVLSIKACDVVEVVNQTISTKIVDTKVVLQDWNKRQMPRFRNDPPSQTCSQCIQMLTEFTHDVASGIIDLEFVSPLRDVKVGKPEILKYLQRLNVLGKQMNSFTSLNVPGFEEKFREVFIQKELEYERSSLKFKQSYESMSLYPEFEKRVDVLCKLGYINKDNTLELKGKVACEMGNHEIILTEMVLAGVFKDMEPHEIAALLSCFVFQQRADEDEGLKCKTDSLKKGVETIKDIKKHILSIERECDLNDSESIEEYEKLNFGLIDVVYEWACGKAFCGIMELTNVQEGIIVRCIQQLNETLRDVKNAACVIGEPSLKLKMQLASDAIKRDIVFAASLYTCEENRKIQVIEDEKLLPVGDE